MKLAYFDAADQEQTAIKEAFPDLEIKIIEKPLADAVSETADADIVSVFVSSFVKEEQLAQMQNIKLIATRSTGVDHIDLAACAARHVLVSNVPTYGQNTVAEHAFALILALSRKIFQSYERTEKMDFDRQGLEGFDLLGKTLGVIGSGHIGRYAVKIGVGFGMKILVYDIKPDEALIKETGCRYVKDLDELLANSDVITVHIPFIPDKTHHLINMDNIKKIKRGAILVNTARGSIIDTAAILWALEEGILSGVGLDVIEEEGDTYDHVGLLSKGFPANKDINTLFRNHLLVARDDVILTPHNAFNSTEAKQRIFSTTVGNIKGFLAGQPVNLVS